MLRVELIRPIPQLLVGHAARFGGKVAFYDDRRSVTYADLAERTRRLAGNLVDEGVAHGDRVLIYLDNSVETAEAYLLTTRLGAVGVCANPNAAPAEVAYQLGDSDARVVITDDAHLDHVRTMVAARGVDTLVLLVTDGAVPPDARSYETFATAEPKNAPRDDLGLDDVAWMLYTSGTTGRPKGVLLTQRSCLWVVAACWAPIVGLTPADRVLCPLPLFHSYALDLCVLGVFAVGATERILPRFTTSRVLELLTSEPFTFMPGVPTMFQYLLHGTRGKGFHSTTLRMCVSAGAIMPAALNAEFEQEFGVQLLEGYGITETSTMVTMNTPGGGRVLGSCGLPLPGVGVRLVDPVTGEDVGVGEEGELWVSGPNIMQGYHNRAEASAEALHLGWYHTGDLGRRDANGFLTISGRTKELIIRGGENIYPAEVEAVLLKVAGVADAAVVARKHADLGEVPVAFVVPDEAGKVDEPALLAACRQELSHFKVPEQILEIDAIPRTGSGKIMRFRLQERLIDA
ncbi:class I adenylate-forming enzyme family protein [Amycolatopsis sp. FDAARGOS 1241]|uniref:class I adenylate-forming enzyme family protein n=1 Tax=Amycolatopsis sp. FDAARGOS 1241 TaxID=2778070 RepID=UPI001951FF17|nr:class I adenylate-forming enzyme family protein [Amycolatopsis sp. FDAARGOS 1241]QRP46329.1 acyl--CoA ligase [Amycolatopsis sp. FDAARGOS 1241]